MNRLRTGILAGLFVLLGSCAFGQTQIDAGTRIKGQLPAANGGTTGLTINGKLISTNPSLTPFDVGIISGPISGSFAYPGGSSYYTIATNIDTINGIVPIWPAANATNIQVVFGNSYASPEVPGPGQSVTAALEYPQGTIYPLFFNGNRVGVLSGAGILYSDPISVDLVAAKVAWVRYHIVRDAASAAIAFPSNYSANQINGTMLAPNTTTQPNGSYDAVELLTTRTVTDGVTNGTTTVTSATAAFTKYDIGQTLATGGTTYTIATWISATSVTLSGSPATATGATFAIVPADKTLTGTVNNGTVTGNAIQIGYAPIGALGTVSSAIRTAGIVGDSISAGTGGSIPQGSWAVQALNGPGLVASSTLATRVAISVPYVNSSLGGEQAANLLLSHPARFAMLGRVRYVLGMMGINDIYTGGASALTVETSLVGLWKALVFRGAKPYYSTLTPKAASTDNYLTVANQTPSAVFDAVRVALNNWLRDGAPVSASTGLPVAIGSATATTNRAIYYVGGVAQVNPTSGVATASGPGVHPASGLFELADTMESSRDSGKWRTDPGNRTVTDVVSTSGSPIVTSATANFTAADVNHNFGMVGGIAGGYTRIASVQSTTQATLVLSASATLSAATATISGVNYCCTVQSGDGVHPGILGHSMLGVEGAKMVAVWP